MMIFELCDLVRERITGINDEVLERLDAFELTDTMESKLKVTKVENAEVTYTPVTKESFAKWCFDYMERLRADKLAKRTAADDKPSGRQLFELNKSTFEDLTLDETEEV